MVPSAVDASGRARRCWARGTRPGVEAEVARGWLDARSIPDAKIMWGWNICIETLKIWTSFVGKCSIHGASGYVWNMERQTGFVAIMRKPMGLNGGFSWSFMVVEWDSMEFTKCEQSGAGI